MMAAALPIKEYTASVVILTDQTPVKTLLVHHRKYDKWVAPGGHQETHENPIDAAVRESQEETGLDISGVIGAPAFFDSYASQLPRPNYLLEEQIPAHGAHPAHVHLDQIYVVRIPQQQAAHNAAEAHDIGWFTLEETEKLTTFENVHKILRKEMHA